MDIVSNEVLFLVCDCIISILVLLLLPLVYTNVHIFSRRKNSKREQSPTTIFFFYSLDNLSKIHLNTVGPKLHPNTYIKFESR